MADNDPQPPFPDASLTEPFSLDPEVLASALEPGQIVWGEVNGGLARLPSGATVDLENPPADGIAGWRELVVVDPTILRARVVELPAAAVDPTPTDDPATLWQLPAIDRKPIARAPSFPVGQGFDPVLALYVAAVVIVALALALVLLLIT
jgi:hypothetical protein